MFDFFENVDCPKMLVFFTSAPYGRLAVGTHANICAPSFNITKECGVVCVVGGGGGSQQYFLFPLI